MTKKPKVTIRQPPDPAAADRFVAQGKTSQRSDVQTSGRSGAGSTVLLRRKDGRHLYRRTVYLPVEVEAELVQHCAPRHIDMSEAITEAVQEWLFHQRSR